ncbi:hypothetical protein FISHEDRAFT_62851 [Fistulina hepatica ATCC 64428]|uniref:FHA domain-containing protein n=1 Tax=Fistulina hepatica ATCC 64428 TaxID=1128425 RepID=A0A0D6ZZE2_9AGAR|nr:hypothetical protein FISHEDRAFT_62851 [Fistulina hepatica ATCC 64428]
MAKRDIDRRRVHRKEIIERGVRNESRFRKQECQTDIKLFPNYTYASVANIIYLRFSDRGNIQSQSGPSSSHGQIPKPHVHTSAQCASTFAGTPSNSVPYCEGKELRLGRFGLPESGCNVPSSLGNQPSLKLFRNSTVSRRHAALRFERGNVLLFDLKSRNGTYVQSSTSAQSLSDPYSFGGSQVWSDGHQLGLHSAHPPEHAWQGVRLGPHVPCVLRDGDIITLGRPVRGESPVVLRAELIRGDERRSHDVNQLKASVRKPCPPEWRSCLRCGPTHFSAASESEGESQSEEEFGINPGVAGEAVDSISNTPCSAREAPSDTADVHVCTSPNPQASVSGSFPSPPPSPASFLASLAHYPFTFRCAPPSSLVKTAVRKSGELASHLLHLGHGSHDDGKADAIDGDGQGDVSAGMSCDEVDDHDNESRARNVEVHDLSSAEDEHSAMTDGLPLVSITHSSDFLDLEAVVARDDTTNLGAISGGAAARARPISTNSGLEDVDGSAHDEHAIPASASEDHCQNVDSLAVGCSHSMNPVTGVASMEKHAPGSQQRSNELSSGGFYEELRQLRWLYEDKCQQLTQQIEELSQQVKDPHRLKGKDGSDDTRDNGAESQRDDGPSYTGELRALVDEIRQMRVRADTHRGNKRKRRDFVEDWSNGESDFDDDEDTLYIRRRQYAIRNKRQRVARRSFARTTAAIAVGAITAWTALAFS